MKMVQIELRMDIRVPVNELKYILDDNGPLSAEDILKIALDDKNTAKSLLEDSINPHAAVVFAKLIEVDDMHIYEEG